MRQIRLLEQRSVLTVAGFGPPPDADMDYVPLDSGHDAKPFLTKARWGIELLIGLDESFYWSRPGVQSSLASLGTRNFDLVLVNDIPALPLGLRLARSAPVLLDAHEYSPGEFSDSVRWRLLFGRHYGRICRKYLSEASAMTTVCQGVADAYQRHFGVSALIIENAPPFQSLRPKDPEPAHIKMVHHGAAIRSRRLEMMIEVLDRLDARFTLDFMLMGNDARYLAELQERASGNQRIRFLSPVPMESICLRTNSYDIGLFLLPPVNYNYRFALPNKLFEFVQARLAVAIGPSTEMARVVHQHGIGIVAESFEPSSLASQLNALTLEDLVRYKRASDSAANELCFEAISSRLLSLIERLVHKRGQKSPSSEVAFADSVA